MDEIVYIIAEGSTEVNFIKNVLSEYLINSRWITHPLTLPTGFSKDGVKKGGWRRSDGYKSGIMGIGETLKINRFNNLYTTFFDLYRFPSDIPCYDEAKKLSSPYDKAHLYENQIKKDIDETFANDGNYKSCLFIPYVQPYEVEAFLFIDPATSARILAEGNTKRETALKQELQKIKNSFQTPEHINNSEETAPSKRLGKIVPGFDKNKSGRAGFSWRIPQALGIDALRNECRHFDEWIKTLETYHI